MGKFVLAISQVLILSIFSACTKTENSLNRNCIEGKFMGFYCEGAVIQIVDNSNIGRDWISLDGSKIYEHSIVASIDTLLTKDIDDNISLFSSDSIFYFKYREGGYARKQYNYCEPSPFLTITSILNTCDSYESD
jgi:hypothetical protein